MLTASRTLVALSLVSILPPSASAQVPTAPIAVTGQAAPGSPGSTYLSVFPLSLNNTGQVAIDAFLAGQSNDRVILGGNPTALFPYLRFGQPVAGTTLSSYDVQSIALSDNGHLAFRGQLADLSTLYALARPATLDVIARQGQPAPVPGGANVYGGLAPFGQQPTHNGPAVTPVGHAVNGNGQVFFAGGLNGAPPSMVTTLFFGGPSAVQVAANQGAPAPLVGGGVTFGNVFYDGSTISAAGRVAFSASLVGSGIRSETDDQDQPANNHALYLQGGGASPLLVARSGNPAPGFNGGLFIGQDAADQPRPFTNVAVTPNGHVRFVGLVDNRLTKGLFVGNPAAPTLAFRAGIPEPGTVGDFYTDIFLPTSNDADQVAFAATNSSATPRNVELLTGKPSALRSIATGGAPVPGLPAGVLFASAAADDDGKFVRIPFDSIQLNQRGQVAFRSFLTGPAVDPTLGVDRVNDEAILATDPAGNVLTVLREGDPYTLATGDSPIITDLAPVAFNDAGQLLIRLRFDDNRTAAILATVPEPGALPLLSLATLLTLRRRRPNASPTHPRLRLIFPRA
jgi:hypothetical protein